ncbi:metal-sulfur cluster assembly factor [Candidatus Woesearchaeota archaeon]|nr:metal-sulfur cluster assembly factor [Candidatus Woesearchaeota archaeon]
MVSKEDVIKVLEQVQDPELGMDIYSLELIYEIKVEDGKVYVKMTFTTPMCPYGPMLLDEVKYRLSEIKGVKEVDVEVSFDPPWEPSPELRATLGV